jgi:hypothetical protein
VLTKQILCKLKEDLRKESEIKMIEKLKKL